MRRCLAAFLTCLLSVAATADHGVILMYHHVDTDTPGSTSVTPDQFRRQLDYIEENGFTVVPLPALLDALYGKGELPDGAVAITFDDAYRSVYRVALPELVSREMPFTVFVATEAVDRGYDSSLSWPQLRELAASGLATFGAHSVTHSHLLEGSEQGATAAWKARVSGEIDDSVARLATELDGVPISTFAYPFGEYSADIEALLSARGLYGLAQQSGAVGASTPRTAIPRFPMARGYDSTERLATALNSRPLPISDVSAGEAFLPPGATHPKFLRFRLREDSGYRREQLGCYSAGGETLKVALDGDQVTVRLPRLRTGRNKINCTAPATGHKGTFYWHSQQWVVADEQGAWLNY